jgi:hypothetical protein
MISPGTDASGVSLPSTATSISRAFGTAFSMTILRSKPAATSMAGPSSAASCAFEMPTLDPRFAGLTNSGNPSVSAAVRAIASLDAAHCVAVTLIDSHTFNPRAANSTFMTALSMPTADASTPQPT